MRYEKGFALVLAMVMSLVLTLMAMGVMNSRIFEIKLAGNELMSKTAFNNAESGLELWRSDLINGVIPDSNPTDVNWTYAKTYTDNGIRADVIGTHVVENNVVKTLNGKPVYRVQSHGYEQQAHRITETVFSFNPSLDPPAALYTHTDPLINSDKATVSGLDQCGSTSKYGIVTTQNLITIKNGTVDGFPNSSELNSSLNIPILQFVDSLKGYANFSNDSSPSHPSWGGTTTDVPVMPVNPNFTPSVVYFDSSVVGNPVKLTSEQGTGILLVKGNLELMGGFRWYGIVAVTGSIKFTGNGNMNITGGVLSGSDVIDEVWISGGVKIYYCSTVKDYLNKIPKTHKKSWHEIF